MHRLFDELVALSPEARTARLEEACHNDATLRRELEALLASYARAGDGLYAGIALEESSTTGGRVGHYEMRRKLGAGGMGVVYEAYDARLQRTVALKFLSALSSKDEQARQRLLAEARAAAALDHPNVGTVYEVGETDDGRTFIAMALYQGETLREKIDRGPLPADEALDYAIQIARGLAAAHAQGIVHRDVKPANMIVTEPSEAETRGRVKILDFGLAKLADMHLTQTGSTLGTVYYMSPEQARGETVDQRTDIWALGIVLYEMFTGVRPFQGEYAQAYLYSIMNDEPEPLATLNPDVPEDLGHILAMCLEKDREYRYPAMVDLLHDLDMLGQGGASLLSASPHPVAASASSVRVPRWAWAGVGVLVALLALVFSVPTLRQALPLFGSTEMPAQRFLAVLPFDNVGNDPENQAFIDGLVYTMTGKLTEMEQFQEALSVVPARDVLQAGLLSTRAAADQFAVNLVLSGSVQRTDDHVRIILQLVDPGADKVLRSRQLDEPPQDMAALQDEVVFALSELLELELNPTAERALMAGQTEVPEAYDFYTQAIGYLQRFEEESNIDAAISLFGLAIKEDPSYALAYAGLGAAYLRMYQASKEPALVEMAIQSGERAVALDDDLAPVQVTLGMLYFETGEYEKAELAYLRALALEPRNAAAYHALGEVYARQEGKLEQAEESYQQAIALKPGYWLYHNDLGQFYHRQGRHQDAIPKFKKVIDLQPDNPWGYNNVGAQYTRLGDQEEAISWYRQATQVNPNATLPTAIAYWNWGGILYSQDDFAEAARTLEQGVALEDNDREAWENLGDAYYWSEQRDKARTAWQRAVALARERLAINPRDARTLGFLAEDLARLGQQDSARAVIDRLLLLDEQSATSLLSIGKTYEILQERDRALTYIEAAMARGYSSKMLEYAAWLDDLRTDARYQELLKAHEE